MIDDTLIRTGIDICIPARSEFAPARKHMLNKPLAVSCDEEHEQTLWHQNTELPAWDSTDIQYDGLDVSLH